MFSNKKDAKEVKKEIFLTDDEVKRLKEYNNEVEDGIFQLGLLRSRYLTAERTAFGKYLVSTGNFEVEVKRVLKSNKVNPKAIPKKVSFKEKKIIL